VAAERPTTAALPDAMQRALAVHEVLRIMGFSLDRVEAHYTDRRLSVVMRAGQAVLVDVDCGEIVLPEAIAADHPDHESVDRRGSLAPAEDEEGGLLRMKPESPGSLNPGPRADPPADRQAGLHRGGPIEEGLGLVKRHRDAVHPRRQ